MGQLVHVQLFHKKPRQSQSTLVDVTSWRLTRRLGKPTMPSLEPIMGNSTCTEPPYLTSF